MNQHEKVFPMRRISVIDKDGVEIINEVFKLVSADRLLSGNYDIRVWEE